MLTKTSEMAIQALVYLALSGEVGPVSPRVLAERLDASPSYMAKITSHLVKANILRAQRGTHGGVMLSRPPEEIGLRVIVEACQGVLLGDYCAEHDNPDETCAYHRAMHELHTALVTTLERWTLAALCAKVEPDPALRDQVNCRMGCVGKCLRNV